MHYLRTQNPMNPEIMAGFPNRLSPTAPTRTPRRAATTSSSRAASCRCSAATSARRPRCRTRPPPSTPTGPPTWSTRVNEFVYGGPDNRGAARRPASRRRRSASSRSVDRAADGRLPAGCGAAAGSSAPSLSSPREEGGALRALRGRRHAAAAAGARRDRGCSRSAARRSRCGSSRAPPPTRSSTAARTASRPPSASSSDFGDEAVVVLVQGDLQNTVLTDDLGRVLGLEGCLSGNVPDTKKGLGKASRPSAARSPSSSPAKVVFGPATFINTAVNRIVDEFAQARRPPPSARPAKAAQRGARAVAAARRPARRAGAARPGGRAGGRLAQFTQYVLAARRCATGSPAIPRIDDPNFVSALVFDSERRRRACRSRASPTCSRRKNAAMITIRLKPGPERRAAPPRDRPDPRPPPSSASSSPRHGAHYVVSGVPVVSEGLADAVQSSIFVLLGAALLVMAATLALVFRTRLRLLPLALALAAAALTFGALSLAGGSLTMASIAVLPVLIGLAVDYAIQFQARFDEQRAARRTTRDAAAAAAAAARGRSDDRHGRGRHRGRLPGAAAVAGPDGARLRRAAGARHRARAGLRDLRRLRRAGALRAPPRAAPAGAAARCARGWPRSRAHPRVARRARVARRPRLAGPRRGRWRSRGRVLAIGAGAGGGRAWRADTQSEVVSDVRELVPQDLQALRDVNALQHETGVSGEIDVTVRARRHHRRRGDRLDDPLPARRAARARLQRRQALHPGATTRPSSARRSRCPTCSAPPGPGQEQVRQLLDAVPPYFSQGVITRDRKTANLAFGIRLMPLDRQKRGRRRHQAPARPAARACEASVVGLPVLAAEANGALSSPWRRGLTLLAALAGVFLVLLLGAPLGARGRRAADPDRARDRLVGRHRVPARPAARARSRSTSTRCRSRSARS